MRRMRWTSSAVIVDCRWAASADPWANQPLRLTPRRSLSALLAAVRRSPTMTAWQSAPNARPASDASVATSSRTARRRQRTSTAVPSGTDGKVLDELPGVLAVRLAAVAELVYGTARDGQAEAALGQVE